MVGKAVKGSLGPPKREAESHIKQRMVFMCPSEEELEGPFPGGSHCWAGGGAESGVGERGEVSSRGAPPESYNGASGCFYDTRSDRLLESRYFSVKKKINVSRSAVFG